MAEKTERDWNVSDQVYQLPVCSCCGSDRIASTEDDSWCESCHTWMSAELVTVGVLPDDPVADAARKAAFAKEAPDA